MAERIDLFQPTGLVTSCPLSSELSPATRAGSVRRTLHVADSTYNPNGGFKPTMKRFAAWARFFPHSTLGNVRPHRE
jgi:hypothetical protein